MADVAMSPDAQFGSTKRNNAIGLGLILLALAAPFIAAGTGTMTSYEAGQSFARQLGGLLLLTIIAALWSRKRTPHDKSKARLVVGSLMLAVAVTNVASHVNEKADAKRLVVAIIDLRDRHTAKLDALGARMSTLNIAPHLTPEALTSAAGIAAGRAEVDRYKALLVERGVLVNNYLSEFDRFVADLPAGDFREAAMPGVSKAREGLRGVYEPLNAVEGEHAKVLASMYDWAHANLGTMGAKNGQFAFQTERQQIELVTLVTRLTASEKSVEKVSAVSQAQADKLRDEGLKATAKAQALVK